MVPDPSRSLDADHSDEGLAAEAGGGSASGFDEAALYAVVRLAVKDALLDVIGTLLLIGIGFVLVLVGVQAALQSTSLAGVALGVGIAVAGVYVAAATLEVVSPISDWF